jgi:hypothetical protein
MGTLARWAAHVAGVGGVLVAVALAAQPHGFLDEGLIDR